jgi:hypothetical protein
MDTVGAQLLVLSASEQLITLLIAAINLHSCFIFITLLVKCGVGSSASGLLHIWYSVMSPL